MTPSGRKYRTLESCPVAMRGIWIGETCLYPEKHAVDKIPGHDPHLLALPGGRMPVTIRESYRYFCVESLSRSPESGLIDPLYPGNSSLLHRLFCE